MWLLNTSTGDFVPVADPQLTRYATLSHVWSRDPQVPEQSFRDLRKIQEEVLAAREVDSTVPQDAVLSRASAKIRAACAYARAEGIDLLWVDTCCIDKSSSADLEEAINSMYGWYSSSTVCYVFLHDVDGREDPYAENSSFRRSEWHGRGWTLQELVAPQAVVFLSRTWRYLGAKHGMASLIEDVTGIDRDVLLGLTPMSAVSVARRMSWASRRVTTRIEDEAYCLMGIFGIHMPVMYGEGSAAFVRLQEEILKYIPDQSIFVWSRTVPIDPSAEANHHEAFSQGTGTHHTLLSPSPALFHSSQNVTSITKDALARIIGVLIPPPTYTITSYGLRVTLPLLPITDNIHVALLATQWKNDYLLGLVLKKTGVSDIYSVGVPCLSSRAGLPSEWEAGFSIITEHGRSTCMVRLPLVANGSRCVLASDLATRPFIGEIHVVHRPTVPQPRPAVGPGLSIPAQTYKVQLSETSQDHITSLGLQISPCRRSLDGMVTTMAIHASKSRMSLILSRCDCPTSNPRELYRFAAEITASWSKQAVLPVAEDADVNQCGLGSGRTHWTITSDTPNRALDTSARPDASAVRHLFGEGCFIERRYILPPSDDLEQCWPLAFEMTLTCDYSGDDSYPALFSLSVLSTSVPHNENRNRIIRSTGDEEQKTRHPEAPCELQRLFNPTYVPTTQYEGSDGYIELDIYDLRKAMDRDSCEVTAPDIRAFDLTRHMSVTSKITVVIEIMGGRRYSRQIIVARSSCTTESISRRVLAGKLASLLHSYVESEPILYAGRQLSIDDLVLLGLRRVSRGSWIMILATWNRFGSEQVAHRIPHPSELALCEKYPPNERTAPLKGRVLPMS